ncbi:MAG: hypothetical protein H0V71_12640, partial [Chloroflexi bacterium]|nr:hypothetical protein [Chloroflexota bacterium]
MADLATRRAAPGQPRLAGLLELAEASQAFRELRERLERGGQLALGALEAGGQRPAVALGGHEATIGRVEALLERDDRALDTL